MSKTTPLYEHHQKLGAKIIDFAGWLMPLHYGSQVEEHLCVRRDVAVFDVSHMAVIDVIGSEAKSFLRRVLANDVQKLQPSKALYSCMLNPHACILDDLIVYFLSDERYRLVVNAATAEKDLAWLSQHAAQFAVKIQPRHDLCILAIQGPKTLDSIKKVFNEPQYQAIKSLMPFQGIEINDFFIARTGYTGEDGLEIMVGKNQIIPFWENLLINHIKPAGLGARDSLRLEAGFNLYGIDMDESVTPLESNLAWTVDWQDKERDFIGKEALQQQLNKGVKYQLIGIVLLAKNICRPGMVVYMQDSAHNVLRGKLTSGGYSPSLSCSVGFARIPTGDLSAFEVDIRGKRIPAKMIKLPFIKKGLPNFSYE